MTAKSTAPDQTAAPLMGVGAALAHSQQVADAMQAGYRLWFDSVTSTLTDTAAFAESMHRSRSTADVAAAQRAFFESAAVRFERNLRAFAELSQTLGRPPVAASEPVSAAENRGQPVPEPVQDGAQPATAAAEVASSPTESSAIEAAKPVRRAPRRSRAKAVPDAET